VAEYVPLMFLFITAVGGVGAVSSLQPPPPKPRPRPLTGMLLMERRGLNAYGLPYVTTGPGDPDLFADVRPARYDPPAAEDMPRKVRLRTRQQRRLTPETALRGPALLQFTPETRPPAPWPNPKVA